MVKNCNELMKGRGKVKVKKLPRKFEPGTRIKFGKKDHSVSYPVKH